MSEDDLRNFSGENRPRSRSTVIPDVPSSSSSFFSGNSISGGTTEIKENNDNLIISSSGKNSAEEKSRYHFLSQENSSNPSTTERKTLPVKEKISSENVEINVNGNGKQPTRINPRLLFLDFIEKNVSNVQEVRQIIIDHTQIRNFSMKCLPKGGISILFTNSTVKKIAEDLLLKKLHGKLRKKGFLTNKKLFEVNCRVPKDLDSAKVMKSIGAEKFIKRGGSEFIFFMPSQESASLLIENGKFIENYQLEFAPFIFAPRIMCKNCGSREHFQCPREVCKSCSGDHKSDQCQSNILKCYFCKGDHAFKDCSQFKEKSAVAKTMKKKTYAEALKKPIKQPLVAPKSNQVIDSKSIELISAYCKVAGIPFKENLLEKVQEEFIRKGQVTSSVEEKKVEYESPRNKTSKKPQESSSKEKSLSPVQEPKKKALKSQKQEYATAVISSYERSTNPSTSRISESPALEMKGIERNIVAKCHCGLVFNPNPGWKNHLYSTKCIKPEVRCPCGRLSLNIDNWSTAYGPFRNHLKKDCKGSPA